MPVDYDEVLKDLDAQILRQQAKLQTLQAARPTIVMLRNELTTTTPVPSPLLSRPYEDMGPTDAIPLLLKGTLSGLTTAQIAERLKAGGVISNAQNFVASVSATLSQLKEKGIVRKIGDVWMPDYERDEPHSSALPLAHGSGNAGTTDEGFQL